MVMADRPMNNKEKGCGGGQLKKQVQSPSHELC